MLWLSLTRLLCRGEQLNFDQNTLLAALGEEASRRMSLPAAAICIFWRPWLQVSCQNFASTSLMSLDDEDDWFEKSKKKIIWRLSMCVSMLKDGRVHDQQLALSEVTCHRWNVHVRVFLHQNENWQENGLRCQGTTRLKRFQSGEAEVEPNVFS